MSDPIQPTGAPSAQPRALAVLLALAAAGCVAYACLTNHWLVNFGDPEHARGFGLRGGWECAGSACTSMPNSDAAELLRTAGDKGLSSAFAPMGLVTLVLLAAAAVSLVIGAVLAIARANPRLPITPTTIALLSLMLALITGCIFVATKPGPPGWVGVGTSFWLFGAGAVLGIAGAQQLARVNRPPDPDLLADAMNPDQF